MYYLLIKHVIIFRINNIIRMARVCFICVNNVLDITLIIISAVISGSGLI
jgi:hypothetical protein